MQLIKQILYVSYFICKALCGVAIFFAGLFMVGMASIYITMGSTYFTEMIYGISPSGMWLFATFMGVSGLSALAIVAWHVFNGVLFRKPKQCH